MVEWLLIRLVVATLSFTLLTVIVQVLAYFRERYLAYKNRPAKALYVYLNDIEFKHTPPCPSPSGQNFPPITTRSLYYPVRPELKQAHRFKKIILYDLYGGVRQGRARINVTAGNKVYPDIIRVDNTYYVFKEDIKRWCQTSVTPGLLL